VGGASTNAAPLAIPPNVLAPITATILPTNAYFAYRTIRQNTKIPM
jgi:hypothetical protein